MAEPAQDWAAESAPPAAATGAAPVPAQPGFADDWSASAPTEDWSAAPGGDQWGGGATENWFAYMLALIFLVFRPQGLFGEKIIERV